MAVGKSLPKGKRVWVIASVDARVERLTDLHNLVEDNYHMGDMLVYTGNIFGGYTDRTVDTVDEILDFRRRIMARFETESDDICYIRGAYEDMLFRLFSLNYDSNPAGKYAEMINSGFRHTLLSYNIDPEKGSDAAKQGSIQLLNFIENFKAVIKQHEGHAELLFSKSLVNYAYTADKSLLLLSAGFNRNLPLDAQKEEISYGVLGSSFCADERYDGYDTVVRGKAYEYTEDGIFADPGYITINPVKCLYAVLFDEDGRPDMMIKV